MQTGPGYYGELNCFRTRCAYVGNWNNVRNCAARHYGIRLTINALRWTKCSRKIRTRRGKRITAEERGEEKEKTAMSTLQLSRGGKIHFYPLQNRVSTIALRRWLRTQGMADPAGIFRKSGTQPMARLSVVVAPTFPPTGEVVFRRALTIRRVHNALLGEFFPRRTLASGELTTMAVCRGLSPLHRERNRLIRPSENCNVSILFDITPAVPFQLSFCTFPAVIQPSGILVHVRKTLIRSA